MLRRLWIIALLFLIVNVLGSNSIFAQTSSYSLLNPVATYGLSTETLDNKDLGSINVVKVHVPADQIKTVRENVFKLKFSDGIEGKIDVDQSVHNGVVNIMSSDLDTQQSEFTLYVTTIDNDFDAEFEINLYNLKIPLGYDEKEIKLYIESDYQELFEDAQLTIALLKGNEIGVQVLNPTFFTPTNLVNRLDLVRFVETEKDSMGDLIWELPDGFYWDTSVEEGIVQPISGFSADAHQQVRYFYSDMIDPEQTKARTVKLPFSVLKNRISAEKSSWFLDSNLKIIVDSNRVEHGDVYVSQNKHEQIKVGVYDNEKGIARALENPKLMAEENQILGQFSVKEKRRNNFLGDRTITLSLPEGVRWRVNNDNNLINTPFLLDESVTHGLELRDKNGKVRWEQIDERTIVAQTSEIGYPHYPEQIELIFGYARVDIDPEFRGDLELTISGTLGISDIIVVGHVTDNKEKKTIFLNLNRNSYIDNGEQQELILAPYIESDRIYLSLRDLTNILGLQARDVDWDPVLKRATIRYNGETIVFYSNDNQIFKGDTPIHMDVNIENRNGYLVLPVAYLFQALEIEYTWNQVTKTLHFSFTTEIGKSQ